jgi:Flp pilus assembly protein TadG
MSVRFRSGRLSHTLGRFRRNSAGAMGVMFALGLTPIIGLIGAAVDYNAASNTRQKLQQAADAAALAGAGLTGGATDEARNKLARAVFASNAAGVPGVDATGAGSLVPIGGGTYRFSFDTTVNTNLMKIIGQPTIPVGVTSDATRAVPASMPTEFVIAFDITTSMFIWSSDDVVKARNAMKSFIDNTFNGAPKNAVVGTVMPFSDRVRLPEKANGWTDKPSKKPKGWGGCLEVREQTVAGRPQTLTDDDHKTAPFAFFEPVTKNSGGSSYTFGCFGQEPTIASFKPDDLKDRIDNMGNGGTGRMDEGMAWAWRMLSPKWKNEWGHGNYPAPYGEVRKLAILITDGRTEAYRYEVLPVSGVASVYGWNEGSERGFDNLEDVCTRMKTAGIEVAVVQMSTTENTKATPHFQDCASPGRHFKIHSLNDFLDAFKALQTPGSSVVRLVK